MTITAQISVSLELVTCYRCGISFGLPAEFDQNRHNDKGSWCCPNGHSQVYTGKPVRDQLSEAKQANLQLQQELNQAQADAAYKARQLASLRRRKKTEKPTT